MTTNKPSHEEEEFFAKEEAEKQKKLAIERARKLAAEEAAALKAAHYMHCPKCGFTLKRMTFRGVEIDRCFNCNGTFLDEGELEQLAGRESGFLQRLIAAFKSS